MRHVRTLTGVALVFGLLAGCSGGDALSSDDDDSAPGDTSGQAVAEAEFPTGLNSRTVWATELIDTRPTWNATTEHPIFTPAYQATFCREVRVTGDAGPHGEHAYWVYTNPAASDAFLTFEAVPVGGVVIKQKHVDWEDADEHREPVALGVMIKREPGYDPEHGDWEYGYITLADDGTVAQATRGQIATCIDCHANRAETDYLFRGYLPGAQPLQDQLFQPGGLGDE